MITQYIAAIIILNQQLSIRQIKNKKNKRFYFSSHSCLLYRLFYVDGSFVTYLIFLLSF